jgi:isoleucyl-tRNA synthetase
MKNMQEEQKDLNLKSEAALREEKILEFWRENKTFQKSLEKNAPKGNYVFYDGPPFATGQIHYGHILGSTAKDVIGRYKTMQGYHVPRKWGWDCHGLPIENIVEKELGVAGHQEIEKLGIDKFVEYARSKVLEYDKDWKKGIERIGRWVDFKGSYKTMDNTFIESVWWALSELNKKDLIYEGVRVLAYCARCETPIANSEIAMDNSYKDIPDISIYVKFELESEPGTYMLAWTTTPWTLPGNTAIAINKNIDYVKVEVGVDKIIIARSNITTVLKDKEYKILEGVSAESLLGKKYKPVFDYYQNTEIGRHENIWKIWHGDFVTTDMGTGIAHEAPAFGEDDMILAKANNIPWIIHVDETGRFKPEVTDFAGLKVKPKDTPEDKDAHLRADIEVIKYLQSKNSYFNKEKIVHSYPHCMRCDTPIIYYALPSWFINIQKVKGDIIKQAESVNWIPSHLKEGRFGHTLASAPDWNISRNRYWASPLPIWKCESCKKQTFVSSLADLKNHTEKSHNHYYVMRHGEAENNVLGISSTKVNNPHHLTEKGRDQVKKSAEYLKDKNIDLIFVSPFLRTRETSKLVAENIGFFEKDIQQDLRLVEVGEGVFEGEPISKISDFYKKNSLNHYDHAPEGGESLRDVKKRTGDFIYEIDKKYNNKNILIITHEDAAWGLFSVINGLNKEETMDDKKNNFFLANAEIKEFDFVTLPHNADYELDLHRPYIDEVKLVCDCGGKMIRIPEVLDCWFESGSMSFAQDHYPMENKDWQKNNFPAGFVAEYIAQTRTWFYYMHVVSTMLFHRAPFYNVVTTGTLRAEDGEKMSKSKKNYPDPWSFIDKYGVDALRIYLMSSTLMKGEDANFSEKAVQDIASKIVGRLQNTVAFYELYRDKNLENNFKPQDRNILDKWILERFNKTLEEVTGAMEAYDMAEATRPIDLMVEDLSTWYLRRSRDRIKDGEVDAKKVLYYVLKNLAKLIAPFAPFIAEDTWSKLRSEGDPESVHLAEWPEVTNKIFFFTKKPKTLEDMQIARNITSLGLQARQKASIPVRQSLSTLKVKKLNLRDEYLQLVKDELNVKEIVADENITSEVELDTNITPVLKAEGEYREFMRELQDRRKKLGLNPGDKMEMTISDIYKKYKIPPNLQMHMLRVAAVASLVCDNFAEPINKEEIITACLLHDMGNIIKFTFNDLLELLEPEGKEYWQDVKNEYIEKYGSSEHEASLKIAEELQTSNEVLEAIKSVGFIEAFTTVLSENSAHKILEYADSRVDPYGVVSLEERFLDFRKRYDRLNTDSGKRESYEKALRTMEKQVFEKCKIKPEDITDASVASIIEEFKKFIIK